MHAKQSLPRHASAVVGGVVLFAAVGLGEAAVVTGAHYEFDANLLGAGERWRNTGGVLYEDFPMLGRQPVPISDPAFPGIIAAYPTTGISNSAASGVHGAYEFAGTGNPRVGDATFELWVNIEDTTPPQILGEVGGGFSGVLFAVSNGRLEFFINGDTPHGGVSDSVLAPISSGWNQVVGTFARADGGMQLYLNGELVGTEGNEGIDLWAGSNAAGLGNFGSSTHAVGSVTFGANDRVNAPLGGHVSVYRFYSRVLSGEEIRTNFHSYALIPEPSTGVLVVLAGAIVAGRRRRSAALQGRRLTRRGSGRTRGARA